MQTARFADAVSCLVVVICSVYVTTNTIREYLKIYFKKKTFFQNMFILMNETINDSSLDGHKVAVKAYWHFTIHL